MRLKDLFTVPTSEKVTEKHLSRVLVSSVCGLLLCMACLVGTTWAWFTDSVVDDGNVIQIGTPQVVLKLDGADATNGGALTAGEHTITVTHGNQADSLAKKSDLFVTFTISGQDKVVSRFVKLVAENGYTAQVKLQMDGAYAFSWHVTWATPAGVEPVADGQILVAADQPIEEPPAQEQPGADDPAEQPGADDPAEQPGDETGGETGGETGDETGGETGDETGDETETEPETT